LENFAPRLTTALPFPKITFSYTHVVHTGDPNPLNNRLDMFFFVHDTEAHPVSFPNKIHGPSNVVTTRSLLSKTIFF